MNYRARPQRGILISFLLLNMLSMINFGRDSGLLYFHIPFTILIIAIFFMNYTFKLSRDTLTFQIRIFKLLLYNKKVSHKQISRVKLKRVGWAKRCVVVHNIKGFNFRVVDFQPKSIFKDVVEFANDFDIPISKTKDYSILERMKS